jgi:hypothetical protein
MNKEKFPCGVIIKVNEKGWMNNSMMKSWVTECFAKRPDGFFHRQRALLDSMCAHITSTHVKLAFSWPVVFMLMVDEPVFSTVRFIGRSKVNGTSSILIT